MAAPPPMGGFPAKPMNLPPGPMHQNGPPQQFAPQNGHSAHFNPGYSPMQPSTTTQFHPGPPQHLPNQAMSPMMPPGQAFASIQSPPHNGFPPMQAQFNPTSPPAHQQQVAMGTAWTPTSHQQQQQPMPAMNNAPRVDSNAPRPPTMSPAQSYPIPPQAPAHSQPMSFNATAPTYANAPSAMPPGGPAPPLSQAPTMQPNAALNARAPAPSVNASYGGHHMPGGMPGPPMPGGMPGPPMPGGMPGPPMPGGMPGPQTPGPPMPSGMPTPQTPGGMPGPPMPGGMQGYQMPGGMSGPQTPGPPMPGGMSGPPMPGGMSGPPMPGGMPGHAMSPPGMGMPSHGNQPSNGLPGMSMPPMPTPGGFPPSGAMPANAAGAGMSQKPKLDPNLMPSAVQVMEDDRSSRTGLFPTGYPHAEQPPLVSTDFFSQDQGNCNPKFMRSSLYAAPASADLLKTSQIPFTIAISPFARLHEMDHAPPIVDLGGMDPIRCTRCKAYMCPFMEFQDGGRKFRCPFCLAHTQVEEAYFAHLDHTGRRTDIHHRPELLLGSYEFIGTKPYCRHGLKPKEPAFIFMLDVSYNAVHNGLVSVFCENIRRMLDALPREIGAERSVMRVGFATFDQTIHFYNLRSSLGQPEMMVVGDVADVFVPLVDGFLVTVDEADVAIQSLMPEIVKMFRDTRITETILGPVVQAGLDALKCSDRAGKLFIFQSSLPVYDAPGRLKNRDDRKILGSDKEKTVLCPAGEFYSRLGEECVRGGCAVDLFLFPNSFIDVATLAQFTALTGGNIYKYQYFEANKDADRFLSDLQHDISRSIAFDVMVRIRTSTGLRPVAFLGAFFMENTTDMEMSALDADSGLHIELRHDDKLPEGSAALIQTAVLFTSVGGQRRLRIHNMQLPVSGDFAQMYRMADQDALVSFLFKSAEGMIRDKTPKETREALGGRCAQILATYREKCSEPAPLGQLILPECLKLLPLYTNCIMKHDAISGGSEMTVDDRAWTMSLVRRARPEEAMRLLYPAIASLIDLPDSPQHRVLLRASYDHLQQEKAYLIDTGLMVFVWIGLAVPQQWVQEVFAANSVTHIDTEQHALPERDNATSRGVRRAVLDAIATRSRRPKLFLIRQGDALEGWMKKFLVEDRSQTHASYVDFLCHIYREIRTLLS